MFKIINENMNKIIPSENSSEENYKIWKNSMQKELENEQKRWIIALYKKEIIGYFLYRVNDNKFFLDEIQIKENHQGDKITFAKLFSYLLNENLDDNAVVYAGVHKKNSKSQDIIKKFDFIKYEETKQNFKYKTEWKSLKNILNKYLL